MESIEVRLARLEEGMVAVKSDTSYIRKGFDGFKTEYWKQTLHITRKVAGVSAITSLVVAAITAVITKAITQ